MPYYKVFSFLFCIFLGGNVMKIEINAGSLLGVVVGLIGIGLSIR